LLDVDRHRKSLSEEFSKSEAVAEIEAQARLQGKQLGVREFAKLMSVSPSSVSRWRRSQSFWERVELSKSSWERVLRDNYFEEIRASGAVEVNGLRINARDGAAIKDVAVVRITATVDSEVVMVDAP
jgi:hypothetical protein